MSTGTLTDISDPVGSAANFGKSNANPGHFRSHYGLPRSGHGCGEVDGGIGVVTTCDGDSGVGDVGDEADHGGHAEEGHAGLHGVDDGLVTKTRRINKAKRITGGVGIPVPTLLCGVGIDEAADEGVVVTRPHVDEAVRVGLVAKEAGKEEGGVVGAFAVGDGAEGGVFDPIGDGAVFVGQGGGVAVVVVMIGGGFRIGVDFVEQARAPDVADGLPAPGALQDLAQTEVVFVDVGGGVAVLSVGDSFSLGVVAVSDASGGGQAVADVVGVAAHAPVRKGAARHIAIGIMGHGLALKAGKPVVGIVVHGIDHVRLRAAALSPG